MDKKNNMVVPVIIAILIVLLLFFLLWGRKYNVKFDVDGVIVETQKVKKNETATKPEDPTKAGYQFANWYLEDEIFDFNTPITKNITLVAKWEGDWITKNYVITIDYGDYKKTINVEKGKLPDLPVPEAKLGEEFVGWEDENGNPFDPNTPITKDITLVPKWQKTKEPVIDDQTQNEVIKLNRTTLRLLKGQVSKLVATITSKNDADKKVIWKSSNNAVATVDGQGNVKAIGKGQATITATFDNQSAKCIVKVILKKYKVSFGNGIASQFVEEGSLAKKPTTILSKVGFKHNGWKLKNAIYNFNTPVTGNITLTPNWIPQYTFTITKPDSNTEQLQSFVKVYYGNDDITSRIIFVADQNGTNLGRYSSSHGAILVKNTELGNIKKAKIAGNFVEITKR